MSTLNESFLADLDDLSDASGSDHDNAFAGGNDAEMRDAEGAVLGASDSLEAAAKLTRSERYKDVMGRVRAALEGGAEEGVAEVAWTGPSEESPTYRLLVDCNQLAVDIDAEIAVIHNWVKDHYRPKFPELESLVHHPIDYARVVSAISNELDLTRVELEGVLPSATIMVVTVTASTTAGVMLSEAAIAQVLSGCEAALQLDADKAAILALVQARMHKIAPNLSTAVGTAIAAKLMGVAGGLTALSQMPACNVQVLGAKRKNLAGFSTASSQPHQGFIFQCDIIQGTPPGLRGRAARLVGAKCTLLARVDAYGQDPSGEAGANMKEDMRKKVEKWQEPALAKQTKVLPAPDMEPKKRRGGKRFRKMKERYGLTDVRKAVNRVNFNQPEEEVIDGDEMVGLGTLGRNGGSGRLRIQARTQKQKLTAKTAKRAKQYGAVGTVSGLSSSLAFTPIQGIELTNPTPHNTDSMKAGTESYFSEYSGFRSLKQPQPPAP